MILFLLFSVISAQFINYNNIDYNIRVVSFISSVQVLDYNYIKFPAYNNTYTGSNNILYTYNNKVNDFINKTSDIIIYMYENYYIIKHKKYNSETKYNWNEYSFKHNLKDACDSSYNYNTYYNLYSFMINAVDYNLNKKIDDNLKQITEKQNMDKNKIDRNIKRTENIINKIDRNIKRLENIIDKKIEKIEKIEKKLNYINILILLLITLNIIFIFIFIKN